MKILSRDFTLAERILLLALSLVVLGLLYYQFVWRYTADQIREAHEARDAMEIELQAVDAKVAAYRAMQQELDMIDASDSIFSRMESYNNVRAEIDLLNEIFSSASQYSMSFSDVTREEDQIRRACSVTFTAKSFDVVEKIISELTGSKYRCLINSVQYSGSGSGDGSVSVGIQITFFETMVGGTPDAGLPQ